MLIIFFFFKSKVGPSPLIPLKPTIFCFFYNTNCYLIFTYINLSNSCLFIVFLSHWNIKALEDRLFTFFIASPLPDTWSVFTSDFENEWIVNFIVTFLVRERIHQQEVKNSTTVDDAVRGNCAFFFFSYLSRMAQGVSLAATFKSFLSLLAHWEFLQCFPVKTFYNLKSRLGLLVEIKGLFMATKRKFLLKKYFPLQFTHQYCIFHSIMHSIMHYSIPF